MKELIARLYNEEVKSIVKISEKAFQINTINNSFLLKYVPLRMENIYLKLSLINSIPFLLPIKSNLNKYVNKDGDKYFIVTPYLKSDELLSKDVRLSFYFKSIALLHSESKYPLRIKDTYFDEAISYLDERIDKLKEELDTRMSRVEKEDYHSPSDWFFIMNYQHFLLALKEAALHVDRLEEERKKENNMFLSLTYQNFSFEHIFPSMSKIVSLEKMALSPSIYDLYDVILKVDMESISLVPYLKEYFDIYNLKQFEKEWLFALLFIPPLERNVNDILDLKALINALRYIKKIEEIASSFYSNEEKI